MCFGYLVPDSSSLGSLYDVYGAGGVVCSGASCASLPLSIPLHVLTVIAFYTLAQITTDFDDEGDSLKCFSMWKCDAGKQVYPRSWLFLDGKFCTRSHSINVPDGALC